MATEGVRVGGVCYVKQTGIDVWFSSAPRSSFTDSAGTTTVYYGPNAAYASGWQLIREYQPVSGSVSYTYAEGVIPSLETCDYTASFFDGVTFGWLVVSVIVAVGAIRLMRRGAEA